MASVPPPLRRLRSRLVLAVVGMMVSLASGAEPSPADLEFFEKRIRPVLTRACFDCHSGEAKSVKGGLRLDTHEALLKGGENGSVVTPGEPQSSRLIASVRWTDEEFRMPPKRSLAAAEIADLEEWVRRGAPWPSDPVPTAGPRRRGFEITDQDRGHWAFQRVGRPVPPVPQTGPAASHPVDAFIAQGLRDRQLAAAPEADRRTLIRRVSYDLLGLPPTPEEVEAFVGDRSDTAWERLIERLLASPHYGEKWGRHWLDLVRFAETNSYERDGAKPNAWRYRDYVIGSFNADKPFDRFVREQLAGDELPDADDEARIATGYYRLGIWDDEPADQEMARYDQLDDLVATTGQVFLGLTVDCARCHDHKIDPIGQRDYYSLLSFFHNVTPYRNGGDTDEVILGGLAAAGAAPAKALVVSETGTNAPETRVLARGNPGSPGDRVEPAFLQVLDPPQPRIVPPASGKSLGRRLALADWIVSPENPLTARVWVNRVWQHHFGRGLVRTPSDFGRQGQAPTHPELLDWLARQFMEQGWSVKNLHRLILNSAAYRRSTAASREALQRDPANDALSHFDMRRLTAEEIRDSLLWVSGPVNRAMHGPGVFVTLPPEVLAGQSVPGSGWGKAPPEEQVRRSVYIHVKRSLLTPILLGFDLAEPDRSTPVRFATTQPTQALGMLNSRFVRDQATRLARRLEEEAPGDPRDQVARALYLVTGRPATGDDLDRGLRLIGSLSGQEGLDPRAALEAFCLLALNLNEFVYLD